jgi:hypothetical protein
MTGILIVYLIIVAFIFLEGKRQILNSGDVSGHVLVFFGALLWPLWLVIYVIVKTVSLFKG